MLTCSLWEVLCRPVSISSDQGVPAMAIALVTGSAGLIGSEAARFLSAKKFTVAGIDNDMRRVFFGAEASTSWKRRELEASLPDYEHHSIDIRDPDKVSNLFSEFGTEIAMVIHAAAQPSHDWAAREPMTDFSVNALGTLV